MADIVIEALILDLLEWLTTGERGYEEVIDVWRTSCCPETGGLGECERSGTDPERASGRRLCRESHALRPRISRTVQEHSRLRRAARFQVNSPAVWPGRPLRLE